MPADITKYGTRGLKGLKGVDRLPTTEELDLELRAATTGRGAPSLQDTTSIHPYDIDSQMGQWGTSGYDDQLLNAPLTDEQMQDTRYENQPWYDSLANGVVKMLGTAGTTFLSSLVGLPAGLYTAASEGRWSGLWDNDVTNALGDVDNWLEDNFKNYKSVEQEENKWWQNLDTMNFWADDVIKNTGFTLGAAASMATGAGAIGLLGKALGMVNNVSKAGKMANAVASALFSATGEGMIEARNGVEERNKLEFQKLQDTLAPEKEALDMEQEIINQEYAQTGDYATYQRRMANLMEKHRDFENKLTAGQQQIEESGKQMGNKILLGNQVLLTAGNMIQFGKAMTKSFDRARHAAEISSKAVKPNLVRAARVGEDIAQGYTIKGKNLGKAWALGKGVLTEGSEEMNQQWIQNTAGEMYNEKDVNDYWRAKLDPDSYRETTKDLYSLGDMISQGFKDSWMNADQWEQFVIGGITGMAGSYSPTKLFNQDKTKSRLDPRRYGSWEGGAYNELKDFNEQYGQYEENINDVNKVLADENFFSRVQNLVARTYSETKKQDALENNDKKTWKDEDDKQTIHDIQAFLRAGKLDDLRTIYDEMGKDLSDEDVDSIIKSTTREIKDGDTTTYEGPFVDKDGNRIVTNDQIREEVKHNSEEMQRKIDSYLDSIDYVNQRTGGQLSKDQEDNLAYLHNLGRESLDRADKIMQNVRQSLPQKFLIKTNKSAEQLAQENTSSDLTFNKDDSTPEGYVEVDTSLMNDRAFSDFFIRDILWGGNIRPEFGETADERARREEEEKGLNDDEKKKRRTAKWKKALEDAKNDAKEQNQTNIDLMVSNFLNNYKKDNRATETEAFDALNEMLGNVADASSLVEQAGQFEKTLQDYLMNPEKVDKDKAKEENKTEKKNKEEEQKNRFAGKTAKDINQDIADGTLSDDDLDDFIGADLSDVTDEDSKSALESAQQEAQKSKDIRQKQAEVKGAIINNAEENGWNDAAVDAAINAVDNMAANADDAADINLDNIADYINPTDIEGASTGTDEMAALAQQVQDVVATGLNSWRESQDKKDDIPDPSTAVSFSEEPDDTGHDSTTKMPAETAVPKTTPQESNEWEQPIPVNTLNPTAVSKVEEEVNKESENSFQSAPWRSTTRRYGRQRISGNRWGTARVPYHELPNAKNPKRSEAIWTYLRDNRAWDNVDNVEADKIKADKTTVHFMVRDFTEEIFGEKTRFEDLTEEQKPQALVILMLDDGGKVLGDLPLAQYERGYNDDTSLIKSPQLKELKATQEKLFKAFEEKRKETGCIQAIADGKLHRNDAENLNLTFGSSRKPFVSKISQILNGIVPFSNEINTLNDIIGDADILLGIAVTGETIATSKDKNDKRGSKARPVRVGNIGQSYILIPSPSGALMPVPFYTKPFDAQKHAGTELYQMLCGAIFNLVNNAGRSDASVYKESIDVIEGLLQVRAQEGARSTVEVTKDNITLHLQSLTDADNKIDIRVPNTGNVVEAATAIAASLSGTPINISLQFINSKIGLKNGRSADYNKVIGEIADANLPKNTTHTVNNAFLVKLTTDAGTKRTEVKYQQSGTSVETIGDKTVKVDYDHYRAYQIDPVTKEETEIVGDEEVNQFLAEAKASHLKGEKNFKIELGGQVRTYKITEDGKVQLVKSSQGSGVNAGQPSINQQKEDRKKGNAGEAASTRTQTQREAAAETTIVIKEDNSKGQAGFRNQPQGYIKNKKGIWVPVVLSMREGYVFEDGITVLGGQGKSASYYVRNGVVAIQDGTGDYLELIPDKIVGVYKLGKDDVTHIDITEEIQKEAIEEQQPVELPEETPQPAETPQQPVEKKAKTIEEIEKEVSEEGAVNRRNQDAWNAIPDALKLKMVNEDVGIVLEYGGNKVTLDYRDLDEMKSALKEANKYAKSGSMTVSEGAKYRRAKSEKERKVDIKREREWLQKNLPMFNTQERLHLIQGLIDIPGEKDWAWGRFEKGIITLSDRAARGTLYHEAFHAVTQTLLSDDELDTLYDAGVKHYKETNVALVEELLAEDFRKYVQRGETPIIGPILKFFRRIMNAMRNLTGYRAPIQELFYRINNGEFSESIPTESRNGNAFYSKIRKDRLLPKDHPMHIAIEKAFNRLNWEGKKGKQLSTFIKSWVAEGYKPVIETYYRDDNGGLGYSFIGVRTNADEEISKKERAKSNRARREAEKHQKEQAVKGVELRTSWRYLPLETQMDLMNSGIDEYQYDNASMSERDYWLDCR